MNCSCRPAVADFQFFKLCNYELIKYEVIMKNFNLHSVNRKNVRFTEWKLEILRFTLRKPEKFPVYGMETGNFTVYVT